MSQHDFSIANQGFPAFRSDLNDGLQALATNSAGSTAPTTTYAYQFWYDTANNLLKMRNGDNDAWITLAAFDQTTDEWEVRSAVIQAVDAGGVEIKTDDGTTRIDVADDGTVTIPGDFVVQGTVTGIDTDKISEGNSSVEVVDSGSGRIEFTTDGSEAMRIDSGGNVGIGTNSPDSELHVSAGSPEIRVQRTNNNNLSALAFYGAGGGEGVTIGHEPNSNDFSVKVGGTLTFKITEDGAFQFGSGFGSVATAYGCRAWVNFNGTGTVAIRESGNVSSITDVSTGLYQVNLDDSMPDADYAVSLACRDEIGTGGRLVVDEGNGGEAAVTSRSTGAFPVNVYEPGSASLNDSGIISVAVFR